MNKPIIKVNNLPGFEFWVNMFRVRSISWQKDNLKRLKKNISCFESIEENEDKIKALEFLLN